MISVIIPLYNKEQTIYKTLFSVLNQTSRNFEIIIVDDGSTDKSVHIIKSNFHDSRVRLIMQQNKGVSSARNNGVKNAKGEWIAFLDADDIWLPNYIEIMYNAINLNPQADMIGCASYVVDYFTNTIYTNRMIDSCFGKIQRVDFFTNPDIMSHIGATCIKKESFLAAGGFNESIKNNEDILLMGKISMNHNYYYVGKMLHVYYINVPGQVTRDVSKKNNMYKDVLKVINLLNEDALNKNDCTAIKLLKFRFWDYFLRIIKENNYSMARYYTEKVNSGMFSRKLLKLVSCKKNKLVTIIYIYIIKILWRINRYQSRSHVSKYDAYLRKNYNDIRTASVNN